jgi:hypothetical protein
MPDRRGSPPAEGVSALIPRLMDLKSRADLGISVFPSGRAAIAAANPFGPALITFA